MGQLILNHTAYISQTNGVGGTSDAYDSSTNPYGIRIINKGADANLGNAFYLNPTNISVSKGVGSGSEPILDLNSGDPRPTVGSSDAFTITMSISLNLQDQSTTNGYSYNDKDVYQFLTLMTRSKGLCQLKIDGASDDLADLIMLKHLPLIYDPISADIERGTGTSTLYSGGDTPSAGVEYGPFWVRLVGMESSNTSDTSYVQANLTFVLDLSYS